MLIALNLGKFLLYSSLDVKKPSYLGKKKQDALVFWMIGKSLLAPDPFSVVPFLTVILPEPDHSAPDREHRLPLRTQGLR